MDAKICEAVGLLRHQIISPVLMEQGRSQMEYFRSLEGKLFDVPGKGSRSFKATTMKMWLNNYKKFGFKALIPTPRADTGGYRKITPKLQQHLLELRKSHPDLSVIRFYEKCLQEELLGHPPLCLATVRRFLKNHELTALRKVEVRKRFEMRHFGELWTGDFMHGPVVMCDGKKRKAILFAVIDDHSRLIVGTSFAPHENTLAIEVVLKESILTYGLPDKIYLDNGPAFSSNYLARACAHLGVALVHSKPYDSPSRGKIERFFRTVRESFLNSLPPSQVLTLQELEERFKLWLRDDYHKRYHQGIGARPLDRYNLSITSYPRKAVDPDLLNEHFMVTQERKVKKDATISYGGKIYECPARFIGLVVEIRHLQADDREVYIYEDGKRVCEIKLVNAISNSELYRPKSVEQISFTRGEK